MALKSRTFTEPCRITSTKSLAYRPGIDWMLVYRHWRTNWIRESPIRVHRFSENPFAFTNLFLRPSTSVYSTDRSTAEEGAREVENSTGDAISKSSWDTMAYRWIYTWTWSVRCVTFMSTRQVKGIDAWLSMTIAFWDRRAYLNRFGDWMCGMRQLHLVYHGECILG